MKYKDRRYGKIILYATVCHFHRRFGRPDNGNYLESGRVIAHDLPSVYTRIIQKTSTALND